MDEKREILNLLKDFDVDCADSLAESAGKDPGRSMLAAIRFLRPLQKSVLRYLNDADSYVDCCLRRNSDREEACVKAMVDKGVDRETIGRFAYCIAKSAIYEVLYRLDDASGGDYDLDDLGESLPSWVLKERDPSRQETARAIYGMHELFPLPGLDE